MNATGFTGARRIRLADDEEGFEAVFDALLFLTILALGTVMLQAWLVTGFEEQEVQQIEQHSAQARDTMEVFLRTWVSYDHGQSQPLRGDVVSVISEAIYLDSLSSPDFDMDTFEERMDELLRTIVAPYYDFSLTGIIDLGEVLLIGDDAPGTDCTEEVCAPVFHARGNWNIPATGHVGVMVELDLAIWFIR